MLVEQMFFGFLRDDHPYVAFVRPCLRRLCSGEARRILLFMASHDATASEQQSALPRKQTRRWSTCSVVALTVIVLIAGGVAYLFYYEQGGWTPQRIEQAIARDLPLGSSKEQIESWAASHGFLYLEDHFICGVPDLSPLARRLWKSDPYFDHLRVVTVEIDSDRDDANVPGGMGLRGAGSIQIIFYLKDGRLEQHELDLHPVSL
jgi:hypothetical protein